MDKDVVALSVVGLFVVLTAVGIAVTSKMRRDEKFAEIKYLLEDVAVIDVDGLGVGA